LLSLFVLKQNFLQDELYHSDESLLALIARDDTSAFTTLYNKYWEELFTRAARLIGNKEDAADIVQEIFLSLWNRRAALDINSSLSAYLFTSVRYQTIHYIEKNITRKEYVDLLSGLSEQYENTSPESALQAKELGETIQSAISRMPPKMKEVYLLSRQEGLTHNQIADRLNISEETVKKHIQHALQLIKNEIAKSSFSLASILVTLFL
jgi:RNA polymerase sigma-70 factor (family 1)